MHILGALQNPTFCSVQLSDKHKANPTLIFLISGFVEILVFLGFSKTHILGALQNPTFCSVQLSDMS